MKTELQKVIAKIKSTIKRKDINDTMKLSCVLALLCHSDENKFNKLQKKVIEDYKLTTGIAVLERILDHNGAKEISQHLILAFLTGLADADKVEAELMELRIKELAAIILGDTKTEIKQIVKDHLPFLKTLTTETELNLWMISVFGITNHEEHKAISEELGKNKIKFEPITSFTLCERLEEHKNYAKKVDEWNKNNK